MKLLLGWLFLLALVNSSCTTRSKATAQAQAAFVAGQQQGSVAAPQQAQAVMFRGDVKNRMVPWTEDLTLAAALIAADYQGLWDPHSIFILRMGQTYRVNPKRLLSGTENPHLEPGDIVEVRR